MTLVRPLPLSVKRLRQAFLTWRGLVMCDSNSGTGFTGKKFKDFLSKIGIKHIQISSYHLASKGPAEGAVRTCKERMKVSNGS